MPSFDGISRMPDILPEAAITSYTAFVSRYEVTVAEGAHLVCSPIYHAAPGGHASGFLHLGHTVVLQDRFDAEGVLRAVERYRVTSVHMVPTHFHRLLRLPEEVRSAYDLSSLEAVIHAGGRCPVPIKQQMMEWLGPRVWEYLGSTEGSVSLVSPQEWLRQPGTVGRPGGDPDGKNLAEGGKEGAGG